MIGEFVTGGFHYWWWSVRPDIWGEGWWERVSLTSVDYQFRGLCTSHDSAETALDAATRLGYHLPGVAEHCLLGRSRWL